MAEKNKGGRPKRVTSEIVQKLEAGFILGLSDREACVYAGLAESTFYDYCKNHPEFSERKETLKDGVKMRAKINIANEINKGDTDMSLWYLERKCKEEFSAKQEIQHSGSMAVTNPYAGLTTEELRKLIDDG